MVHSSTKESRITLQVDFYRFMKSALLRLHVAQIASETRAVLRRAQTLQYIFYLNDVPEGDTITGASSPNETVITKVRKY